MMKAFRRRNQVHPVTINSHCDTILRVDVGKAATVRRKSIN